MDDDIHDTSRWRRRLHGMRRLTVHTLVLIREVVRFTIRMLGAAWRLIRPVLRHALQFLLALIIVFEEWGWRPLADLLGRLARWRPWARLETAIARLPPYAALVVFVLPSTLLLPLKFLAIFLVARGQIVMAGLLFVAAKIVATALIARLFLLTQPSLMQIGWFAWGYDIVMPWKEALVDMVHNSWTWRVARVWKERTRRILRRQWLRMRPTMIEIQRTLQRTAARLRVQGQRLVRAARARLRASLLP